MDLKLTPGSYILKNQLTYLMIPDPIYHFYYFFEEKTETQRNEVMFPKTQWVQDRNEPSDHEIWIEEDPQIKDASTVSGTMV